MNNVGLEDLYFDTFAEQFLQVTTDLIVTQSTNPDLTTSTTVSEPMIVLGYLLSFDDVNYYFGSTLDEITQAVARDRVVHTAVIKLPQEDDFKLLDDKFSNEPGGMN